MTRILPLLLLAALAAAPAGAQARYRPQPDTLYYESMNPYRMYVVRGADTMGGPVRGYSIQRQVWRAAGGGLTAQMHDQPLAVHSTPRGWVLEVTPRGEVRTDDGEANKAFGHYDALLRLPADGDLREGRVWHDTLSRVVPVPGGEYAFQTWRELRVERIADTLGSRMAIVRGTGRMRYRHTDPVDSAGSAPWWMDVTGPMRETFVFDLANGRLAGREWWMDLRGIGGFPRGDGGIDTVPAGLLSSDTTRLIGAERARLVGRPLEGDTMVTSEERGDALLHAVRRDGGCIRSGLVRNDGGRMTAEGCHAAGLTPRYAFLYTEPVAEPLRRTIELVDGVLRVSGDRDTTLAVPPGRWAMADYGMDEHLAPHVAAIAAAGETEAEISVLRPFTLRWEQVAVGQRMVDDLILARLGWEGDGGRDEGVVMVVTKGGDLLYAEGTDANPSVRQAPEGSERRKRIEALRRALEAQARP